MSRVDSPLWDTSGRYSNNSRQVISQHLTQNLISPSHSWVFNTCGTHSPKRRPTKESNVREGQSNYIQVEPNHSWVFRTHRQARKPQIDPRTSATSGMKDGRYSCGLFPRGHLLENDVYHSHHHSSSHFMDDNAWKQIRAEKFKNHRRKLKHLLDEPMPSELPLPCMVSHKEYDTSTTSEDDEGVAEFHNEFFEEEYAQRLTIGQQETDTLQALREVSMGGRPISSRVERDYVERPLLSTRPLSAPVPELSSSPRCHLVSSSKELIPQGSKSEITYFFPDIQDLPDPGRGLEEHYLLGVPSPPHHKRKSRQNRQSEDLQSKPIKDKDYLAFRDILAQSMLRKDASQRQKESKQLYVDECKGCSGKDLRVLPVETSTYRDDSIWLPYSEPKEVKPLSRGKRSQKKCIPFRNTFLKSTKTNPTALRNNRWAPSFLVQEYYLERVSEEA